MSLLKNIKLKTKLVLMVFFPIVGLLFFSTSGIVDKMKLYNEMNSLQSLSVLAVKISNLVHETQKERGATAGFLGSGGADFVDQLKEQRRLTDGKVEDFSTSLGEFDASRFGAELKHDLDQAVELLDVIDGRRDEVSALKISANEAISYYTEMNSRFLAVVGYISKLSSNAEIGTLSSAYVNFLLGKERAGIERAVLSNTFAADRFGPGMFRKFSSLVTEQQTYKRTFLSFATPEQKEFFESKITGRAVDEVERMRKIAFDKETKNELISTLVTYVGYGGIIHQFKNYVLRGRDSYIEAFNRQYQNAIDILDKYLALSGLSESAMDNAEVIWSTLDNYAENMEVAISMKKAGASVGQIDSFIKISDGPAIEALNKLLTEGNFGVEAGYWFQIITEKINLLKEVEDELAAGLDVRAEVLKAEAQTQFMIFIGFSFALILLTLLITIFGARGILKQMGGEPASMAKIAQSISEGDLSMQLKDQRKTRTGIYASFVRMLDSLNEVLGQVNTSVEQVSSGSDQVAQAGQSLSQGATEQASSLEEVTSSLNEISSQSKQNAESATEANSIAKTAVENAESGNEQMSELVGAMEKINESSAEIKKVVKVIDDIAFQINLLALNANVEAARAGKYGKGFAVVAEEVRNLAVRSAEAVKETTRMVEESTKSIELGRGAAEKTAKQLEEIVSGSSKVADFLGEIALASKEQAQGVEQINSGLEQIDQVTQSNTASAEESASAAEELSSQAQQLKALVARFKLAENGRSGGNGGRQYTAQVEPERRRELGRVGAVDRTGNDNGDSGEKEVAMAGTARKGEAGQSRDPREVINLDDDDFGKF